MTSPLELRTDADYLSFLTREYGWQIGGPFYMSAPQPNERYIGRNQREFDLITHYLTGTYIIRDQFDTDHLARRIFLDEIKMAAPNVREWIKVSSKLKKNRIITDAIMSMDAIILNLENVFPAVYQQVQSSTSDLYSGIRGYDAMPFDDKVSFAHQVDNIAYTFLEELGK